MSNEDIVIGIDFGTTNSAACIYMNGKTEIIPNLMGYDYFPSVVAVNEDGDLLIGHNAKKQMESNASNTVSEFKLDMGKDITIRFDGEDKRPQEIAALVLGHIKDNAEAYLGRPINKAVISVPAGFDEDARNATIEAGKIAGFEVEALVDEPTAACLAYSVTKNMKGNILVFDMRGGTLDITIGYFDGSNIKPKSITGAVIGGRFITHQLRDYARKEFEEKNGLNLEDYITDDYNPIADLINAAEIAKIELSSAEFTNIHIDSIIVTDEGKRINLDVDVNRSKLNELSEIVVKVSKEKVMEALSEAKLSKDDIDYLVFVGGPTKMPLIRDSIEEVLGKSAEEGIDPSLCVVEGAALYLAGPIVVEKINSLTQSLVTSEKDSESLIAKNASLPEEVTIENSNKNIEVTFEFAGFEDGLIDDLSSRFGGLSIEDKMVLIELMDYFKGFRLSLTDINDLIREYVLEGGMSLDSFNENREYIVNTRIEENNENLVNPIREDFKIKIAENKRLKDENNKLKNKNVLLSKENELLSEDYENLKQNIQNRKGADKKHTSQPNSISEYNKLIKDMGSSIENLYYELINQLQSCLRDDFNDASSMNSLSGFMNMDYEKDLKVLEDKFSISKDVLNTFELAFENFYEGKFDLAFDLFRDTDLIEAFHRDELQTYREFLEVTSLSRDGKIEEAYGMIESEIKGNKKIDENIIIEQNPIRWFNFGNICFDYANLQSVKDDYIESYELAYSCYDRAKESFKSGIFKFSDKKNNWGKSEGEKKFIENVKWMVSSRKIYRHLIIREYRMEFKLRSILKNLSDFNSWQGQIFHDLEEIKNLKQK